MSPTFSPPVNPQQIPSPSRQIYALMGEENIRRMIADFYGELELSKIRGLFPAEMRHSAEKTSAFFIGLLGGPPLYHQRYGNPMMRARHLPFPIDRAARDEWLACFERVLENAPDKYQFPPEHLQGFRDFLSGFSLWMMNRE